jgi:hypothetical protein
MDDDIFEDDGKDFLIEQKSTERLMNDIYSNGYRDAFQAHSEDEKLHQKGFDDSYPLFVRLGVLLGQIRSMCSYGPIMRCKVANLSAFLARLNNKLDKIEKEMNYESLIAWKDNDTLEPDYSRVIESIRGFETKLTDFKDRLSVLVKDSSNSFKSVDECMNSLDENVKIEYEDFDADENPNTKKNFDLLNDLVEGLNF